MLLKNQDRGGRTPANQRKTEDFADPEHRAVPGSLPGPQQSHRQKRINLKWTIKQMPEWSDRDQNGKNGDERELKSRFGTIPGYRERG